MAENIARIFLSGNWQYWSNLRALTTVYLYIYSFSQVGVPKDMNNYIRGSSRGGGWVGEARRHWNKGLAHFGRKSGDVRFHCPCAQRQSCFSVCYIAFESWLGWLGNSFLSTDFVRDVQNWVSFDFPLSTTICLLTLMYKFSHCTWSWTISNSLNTFAYDPSECYHFIFPVLQASVFEAVWPPKSLCISFPPCRPHEIKLVNPVVNFLPSEIFRKSVGVILFHSVYFRLILILSLCPSAASKLVSSCRIFRLGWLPVLENPMITTLWIMSLVARLLSAPSLLYVPVALIEFRELCSIRSGEIELLLFC